MSVTEVFMLIFALILILLVTGRYHRSVAALIGALLTILFGVEYGIFHLPQILTELIELIDMNTILLAIGVMILAEAVARTGFFEFIGLKLAKLVGSSFRRISLVLIILTAFITAFVTTITAMVIMGALTISLARRFEADPSKTIIYEAVMTNVGGLMLMISSIPNLIVASFLDLEFIDFMKISLPLALLIILASTLYLYPALGDQPTAVREIEIDPWSVIEDKQMFYRAMLIFALAIALFILRDFIGAPLGLIAIGCAIAILALGSREPESIFSSIDWGTIFFLASFYVIVGGLEKSGVLELLARGVFSISTIWTAAFPAVNMWICAATSSIIDNIPVTMILIPVMKYVSQLAQIPISVLGWSMIFGANLGGSLTPIGAPSCIIAVGILRREGRFVSWSGWLKRCLPLVAIQLLLATAYTLLLLKS